MNFSYPFIKRPVMTTMVMLAILLFGAIAIKMLPVSDLPDIEYPTILVSAQMPGGNPQYMADSVATPLEQAFTSISGLNVMTSTNTPGRTEIVLNFDLNRNIDGAEVEVQGAISRTLPLLPPMPNNPIFQRVNPSQAPVLYLTLSSDTIDIGTLYDYAKNLLAEPISMISGVSEVNLYGYPYAVRVEANPELLYIRNLDLSSLAELIVGANPNLPGGSLIGPHQEWVIEPFGMLTTAKEYNNATLKQENGNPLKLEQVARATDALLGRNPFFHLVTKQGIQNTVALTIKRQSDANTIAVTQLIHKKLPELQKSLPASVKLTVFFDDAKAIISSVHEVEITLLIAFALVVLVIYLYLGNWTETVIPALVLPMSIITTFIVMYLLNFSIDNLSLLALILAIGFIVDDAIVVLENIVRHVEMGKQPMQAAIDGSKEISTTVVTMTLSLAAVFIPLVAMPGMLGRIFREFSITIIVTILASGFISLTLNPMLCSRFLKAAKKKKRTHFTDRLLDYYMISLKKVFRFKGAALLSGLGCFIFSFLLILALPFDFFPGADLGIIQGMTQCEQGSSLLNTNTHQTKVDEKINANPHIDAFLSVTGNPTSDQGLVFIRLSDEKRPKAKQIIASLMRELWKIPGINTYLMPMPLINLQVGNSSSLGEYQFALNGLSAKDVYAGAKAFTEKLKSIPEILHVNSDLKIDTPQLNFHILRDQAGIYGVNAFDIEQTLQLAYAGGRISTFNRNQNLYDLILEAEHPYQYHISDLNYLYVKSQETRGARPSSLPCKMGRGASSHGCQSPQSVPFSDHLFQLSSTCRSWNCR